MAAPLFSTLPELVVSDLGLDGNAHSGEAASCRALDFTRRPLRRIPSLVEPSIQTCSRYVEGVLLRIEECLMTSCMLIVDLSRCNVKKLGHIHTGHWYEREHLILDVEENEGNEANHCPFDF